MATYLHLFFGYILTQYLVLAVYDSKCTKNKNISTILEFNKYYKECQGFLHDVLKRLPLHANADYIGCFEYSGGSLGVYSTLNSSKMNIETCIWNCKKSYLTYAGIKNGKQCLCAIMNTAFKQVEDTRCSTICPTDFRLFCGGAQEFQLYNTSIFTAELNLDHSCSSQVTIKGGKSFEKNNITFLDWYFSYVTPIYGCSLIDCDEPVKKDGDRKMGEGLFVGCFVDDKKPLLSGNFSTSSSMRIETCLQKCEKSRNLYAGLKKTNVCLCGNDTIRINASSDVHCQLRCAGNISQSCGGVQHLQLYRTSIPLPTRLPQWHRNECFCGASVPENPQVADFYCDDVCTGNKSQFCGAKGLDSSNSSIFIQVYEIKDSKPFISPEGIFLGCYMGAVDDLQQMKKVVNPKNLTIDSCLKYCQQKGLKFAALEKGSHCACGQLYDNMRKTSNAECNRSCPGNRTQNCGGNNRVQIHGIKLFPKRFTPYGIYLGCFQSIPSEMNKTSLQNKSMTLNICIKHCWERGLVYAALKQGNTCFCGKNSSPDKLKTTDSHCNVTCSSDDGNFCGGKKTFQIYNVEYLLRRLFGVSSISMATDLTWA